MLFALAIFVTACVVIQVFLKDVYTLELVGQGLETPGPDFEDTVLRDLRANGIIIILVSPGLVETREYRKQSSTWEREILTAPPRSA